MPVSRVTQSPAEARGAPRAGLAMAVIMTGVLAWNDAFTSGLHAGFYASMGFMVIAAALPARRPGPARLTR